MTSSTSKEIDFTKYDESLKFTVIKELSSHSDSQLFEVRGIKDSENTVLKVIRIDGLSNDTIEAFYKACTLKADHIAMVIPYVFKDDNMIFLKMPIYPFTLNEENCIEHFKHYNIFNCLFDICDGMIELHSQGIVHGNLKPTNILMQGDGRNVLVDHCKNNLYMGTKCLPSLSTCRFIAPEILKSEGYDYHVDLWSFGCLMYLFFSGSHAFNDLAIGTLVVSIIDREPEPLKNHYSSYVNVILQHLLNKDPTKRFDDTELKQALTEFNEKANAPSVIQAKYFADPGFDGAVKRVSEETSPSKKRNRSE